MMKIALEMGPDVRRAGDGVTLLISMQLLVSISHHASICPLVGQHNLVSETQEAIRREGLWHLLESVLESRLSLRHSEAC